MGLLIEIRRAVRVKAGRHSRKRSFPKTKIDDEKT
jgi:hypothetical protein